MASSTIGRSSLDSMSVPMFSVVPVVVACKRQVKQSHKHKMEIEDSDHSEVERWGGEVEIKRHECEVVRASNSSSFIMVETSPCSTHKTYKYGRPFRDRNPNGDLSALAPRTFHEPWEP